MLEVTGIEKRYRGRTILKDVSFRANASGLSAEMDVARRRCSRSSRGSASRIGGVFGLTGRRRLEDIVY